MKNRAGNDEKVFSAGPDGPGYREGGENGPSLPGPRESRVEEARKRLNGVNRRKGLLEEV